MSRLLSADVIGAVLQADRQCEAFVAVISVVSTQLYASETTPGIRARGIEIHPFEKKNTQTRARMHACMRTHSR